MNQGNSATLYVAPNTKLTEEKKMQLLHKMLKMSTDPRATISGCIGDSPAQHAD